MFSVHKTAPDIGTAKCSSCIAGILGASVATYSHAATSNKNIRTVLQITQN